MTVATAYHIPALLRESVDGLNLREDGVYVDVTFGGGGHSRAILSRLPAGARLFSMDKDADAAAVAGDLSDASGERFTFIRSDFRYLKNWMRYYGVSGVHGLIADLGVSGHQLDERARGFSFRTDAPLDMRMNTGSKISAATVVNDYPENALADILYHYGELRGSRRIAAVIVQAREKKRIATTGDLCATVAPLLPFARGKKDMARVFQALRIEVNGEMGALRSLLDAAAALLVPGGRLCVIAYHSLEDRMVKNMIRTGNVDGHEERDPLTGRRRDGMTADNRPSAVATGGSAPFRAVNGRVIVPTDEERKRNPRCRSARLRIAERI